MTTEPRLRPLGVVALAILDSVGGLLSLVLGLYFLSAMQELVAFIMQDPTYSSVGSDVAALGVEVFSSFFLVVGLLALVNAYGLWKAKGWAWWMALILALLGAFSSVLALPLGVVSLAVEVLILYYLTRRKVRDYFRPIADAVPPLQA